MRVGIICLAIVIALICIVQAEMPLGFYEAVNNGQQKEVLSVRNFDAGASVMEAYTDFERLDRNTQANAKSYQPDPACAGCSSGSLEASINSNAIGKAHIAWQSMDISTTNRGRHNLLGRSIEDLTGVFSIEKFIQLWSSSLPGEISVDWLPCT